MPLQILPQNPQYTSANIVIFTIIPAFPSTKHPSKNLRGIKGRETAADNVWTAVGKPMDKQPVSAVWQT